jgi:LPXTG-site transpeptidase (sortase) family protein
VTLSRILQRGAAAIIGITLGGSGLAGLASTVWAPPATAAARPIVANRFVPVPPQRLLDTRRAAGARLSAGKPVTLAIPSAGRAVSAALLNVTVADAAEPGYLTVFPDGTPVPESSNLNAERAGVTTANLVTVQVGTSGAVALYSSFATDLIVDLVGVYEPTDGSAAGRFVPVSPARAFDSRSSGGSLGAGQSVRVGLSNLLPSSAAVAVVNLTAVDAPAGFWTASAAGSSRPATSNLNIDTNGDTLANQAYVALGSGAIDVYSDRGGHLIVDVVGYITNDAAPVSTEGLFVPIRPVRVLDTRAEGTLNPVADRLKPRAGSTLEVGVGGTEGIPTFAAGVAMNVTVAHANAAGFVTVWPAGSPLPGVSNVNTSRRGQITANHVVVAMSFRGVALRTSESAHLLADVTGWFVGHPASTSSRYKPDVIEQVSGRLRVPAIGFDLPLGDGLDDATLDKGPMHWTISTLPGELGTTMVLGHRWSHSAPFYRLAELRPGDVISIDDTHGHFEYRVTTTEIHRPDDVAGLVDDSTANVLLVACHPIGGVSQRIVVRAVLG